VKYIAHLVDILIMDRKSLVLWEDFSNVDINILLDMVDGLRENEEIEFTMRLKDEFHEASIGRGNVSGCRCKYYVRIGKDYDLFWDRESCFIFLEHCKKFG
jgi:hypothetical protein